MPLALVTPPVVEPLSPFEAKLRLGMGDEIDDRVIGSLITAARQTIDGANGWLGRAINTQTWDLLLDRFPDEYSSREQGFNPWHDHHGRPGPNAIPIPLPPFQSIVSVKYFDPDFAIQTLDPSTYAVYQGEPAHLAPDGAATWPATARMGNAVAIRFVAGYGDHASDVPETIRTAIALQVSHLRSLSAQNLFVSREDVTGVGGTTFAVSPAVGNAINSVVTSLLSPLRVWQ